MRCRPLLLILAAVMIAITTNAPTQAADNGWIGVHLYPVSQAQTAELGWPTPRGARVLLPIPSGPAAAAGITTDDIILSVNDIDIANSEAFASIVAAIPPGTRVRLKLHRAGTEHVVTVVPAPRPASIPPLSIADLRGLAEAGNARAMALLGLRYVLGEDVPQDDRQARSWYSKAIAGNDDWAFGELGRLYAEGLGGPTDYELARRLLEKAITLGDANAMNSLGLLYDRGRGVRQDPQEARRWYEKAAAANNPYAMNNLGLMYETGAGVNRDAGQAKAWYLRAIAAGSAAAKDNLRRLEEAIAAARPTGRSTRRPAQGGNRQRSSGGSNDGWVAPPQPKFYPPGANAPGYSTPGGGTVCIGPHCH